ncbi:efflux RND transporter periplasmic adaptor subunit [uncultured Enterovirga sp.]|uniref:efflux RND transporter periplasmic adaptor subunit n=1 Tax=uncultured Enterovirga sp. TaxID=2026352 RepID=UPI0035C95D77
MRPSSRPNTTRREGLQTQSPRSNPPVPAPAVSADRARPEPETIAERSPVRWGLWFATLALLIGAASAGWWYWTGSARAPAGDQARSGAAPPQGRAAAAGRIPVDVAQVTVSDVPIFYESLGTVQAFNNVTIRSRVDGEVMEIAFEEGQTVQEGALLARVDPRPYKAALDQALARKAQNEATLAATRLDLERTQKLASQSFASQQQLDQQTATLGSQTAQLASDQAAIDNARTQLDYATIRAPISGRTGLRLVDRGNIVRAGDATGIVEIAQLQPISVLFTAPEGQLPAIAAAKRGGDVRVQALAPDGRTILGEGVLALINNTVDPASGTVRLKATFPNAEDRLWPGLSVNTRLLVQTLRAAVNIPEAALLRGQNELFVYVVGADDKAEKRLLKVGAFSEGRVVIEDGLRAGEKVVVAGQSRLLPGSQIQTGPSGPGREDERAAGLAATPGSAP